MSALVLAAPIVLLLSYLGFIFGGVLEHEPLPLATKVGGWLVLGLCGSTAVAALIRAVRARLRGSPAGVHLTVSVLACFALFWINGAMLWGGF